MLDDILRDYNAKEVSAMDVYKDMFKLGEGYIQHFKQEEKNLVANPLGYARMDGAKKGRYRVFFEDTFADTLKELQEADFAIVNGITYFGRKNLQEHASKMFAMIFDLDGVNDTTLNNFLHGAYFADAYPVPNYIALSGHGIHLYYVFEEPIALYPQTKVLLKQLKYALTDRIWNTYTSTIEKPQYQGINQGFRPVGGKTKIEGVKVRAFRLNEHPFDVEELNNFVPEKDRVDLSMLYKESRTTLEEAKAKFPQWYQRVIVDGDKTKGSWTCKRDLYEWWKRQIKEGAVFHHRYFCTMCLAIFAVKSGVSYEELEKDALDLVPFMNDLSPENPFTEADVYSALECFDSRYVTFPVEDISRLSSIEIQKNKRNGRKQSTHLRIARNTLEILNDEAEKPLQGRKSKADIVRAWQRKNPEGTKAECIRQTKLSKPTVYKHWR